MPINTQGVYVYAETDMDAKASDMLNRQSTALTTELGSRLRTIGGDASLTIPAAGGSAEVTIPIPPGAFPNGARPVAVTITSMTAPSTTATVTLRVKSRTATAIIIEGYKATSGAATISFFWMACA